MTVLLIPLIGAWCFFTWWTLRRLLAGEFRRRDAVVFRYGVLGFGVSVWIGGTYIANDALAPLDPGHSVLLRVAAFAFYLLPICLWVGYFWGKGMALIFPGVR